MIGTCPVCGRLLVPTLVALGPDRAPKMGDLTVCACRSLLMVVGVSPWPEAVDVPEQGRMALRRVAFRRAGRAAYADAARLMDEARLARDPMPGDKFRR